jgi:L,D-transpeptidase ErfK/SrfK
MPVKLRDSQVTRSVMLLCFATAGLLLAVQWVSMTTSLRAELGRAIGIVRQPGGSNKPAAQLSAAAREMRLVVDLSDRRVVLYKKSQSLASYTLAIAKEGWETPVGSFKVLDMERNPTWIHPITNIAVPPGADNPLGKAWIGFWSDGNTEIGFHGTNEEDLIGQAVSHGCLRMRNQDIEAIYRQIAEGTPVVVQP